MVESVGVSARIIARARHLLVVSLCNRKAEKKDGKTLVCFRVLLRKLTTDRSEASIYLIKSTIL